SSIFAADYLFCFAERRYTKRSFLLVSRVLGRDIPARPGVMLISFQDLAHKIPPDLPGPVLVIGMAETAFGLAAGVHRAYSE
ncbi:phosphoribosyltransferase domain-containing protein, partial [Pseudomonas syringae group genomosp. 7]|uniref:phosphoribosyltransferase domain-containing protein n=1 Tax=Pseudomonas syringae group genomosp. 7 TaxID=251699 RepID=UPI00376F68F3